VKKLPLPEDLRVFMTIAECASFSGAANRLGLSTSAVSKRVQILEGVLGRRLFTRSAQFTGLTVDGKRLLAVAPKVLDMLELMTNGIGDVEAEPCGELRVCSSFGFGRNYVTGPLGRFAADFPQVDVHFEVFDRLVNLEEEGFDLDIRVGDEIAGRHIATRLASNHRILCASPHYLRNFGAPLNIYDLKNHQCLLIRERDHALGIWNLQISERHTTLRVKSRLISNNGEIIQQWARDGHGIIFRSIWDVALDLVGGTLVHILPEVKQEANIWAVHPERLSSSSKTQACVSYIRDDYSKRAAILSNALSTAGVEVSIENG
jgi:LysR family transcriptional regulator, transcriptional activator for dmlA